MLMAFFIYYPVFLSTHPFYQIRSAKRDGHSGCSLNNSRALSNLYFLGVFRDGLNHFWHKPLGVERSISIVTFERTPETSKDTAF